MARKLGQTLMGRGSNSMFETEKILMGQSTEREKSRSLKILGCREVNLGDEIEQKVCQIIEEP